MASFADGQGGGAPGRWLLGRSQHAGVREPCRDETKRGRADAGVSGAGGGTRRGVPYWNGRAKFGYCVLARDRFAAILLGQGCRPRPRIGLDEDWRRHGTVADGRDLGLDLTDDKF